jgi:hypothetical protein
MTVLRQRCAVFCKNLQICDLQINHKYLRICHLRLAYLRNLSMCDSGMSSRICGFAICGL